MIKKLFGSVSFLFILYMAYQIIFTYFQGGHLLTYNLVNADNTIIVVEKVV